MIRRALILLTMASLYIAAKRAVENVSKSTGTAGAAGQPAGQTGAAAPFST